MNVKAGSKEFLELLKKLSTDPKIKSAIESAKAEANSQSSYQATSVIDLIIHLLKYSSTFVGKKKAEKITEYTGYIGFLITISLLLKKNIFDRPEVREFFIKNWVDTKILSVKFYDTLQGHTQQLISNLKSKFRKKGKN